MKTEKQKRLVKSKLVLKRIKKLTNLQYYYLSMKIKAQLIHFRNKRDDTIKDTTDIKHTMNINNCRAINLIIQPFSKMNRCLKNTIPNLFILKFPLQFEQMAADGNWILLVTWSISLPQTSDLSTIDNTHSPTQKQVEDSIVCYLFGDQDIFQWKQFSK